LHNHYNIQIVRTLVVEQLQGFFVENIFIVIAVVVVEN